MAICLELGIKCEEICDKTKWQKMCGWLVGFQMCGLVVFELNLQMILRLFIVQFETM